MYIVLRSNSTYLATNQLTLNYASTY